jgi:hypothetical protein
MASDPSDVDAALCNALKADTGSGGLMTLMTDGVYMDIAPSGVDKFVIVSLLAHEDAYQQNGSSYERSVYLVKAVERNTVGTRAKAAAARIQAVLQDVRLTITGYSHMLTEREERIRYAEVDEEDRDTRWQHRGGRYAVWVCPT